MHILIVDDEDDMMASMREALLQWNHQVQGTRTGLEALRMIHQEDFDLVLLDIFLPECLGHELIPEFKALRPHMGIVTMTGYNSRALELEVRKQGVFYYLIKPFTLGVLKEIVDHISRMKRKKGDVSWLH